MYSDSTKCHKNQSAFHSAYLWTNDEVRMAFKMIKPVSHICVSYK